MAEAVKFGEGESSAEEWTAAPHRNVTEWNCFNPYGSITQGRFRRLFRVRPRAKPLGSYILRDWISVEASFLLAALP